ncbi:uracil-DNA glycosylase [Flexivirga sp. B27]
MSSARNGVNLPDDWFAAVGRHGFAGDIDQLVSGAYDGAEKVFPPKDQVFRAFQMTPLEAVRVVIVGQDPYPREGQANGLAFSFDGNPADLPRSLRTIYNVLEADLGGQFHRPSDGDLAPWTREGVLLLNATLTVPEGTPGSAAHRKRWKEFTDAALRAVDEEIDPVVFLLWGWPAIRKVKAVLRDAGSDRVLCSSHPAAWTSKRLKLFKDSRPFSAANERLSKSGRQVNWDLTNAG